MFDLEQKRTINALDLVKKKLVGAGKDEKKMVLGLPALIQKNGLAMTGLYLLHKKFNILANGLKEHLGGSGEAKQYYLDLASKNSVLKLQAATQEAKMFAGWIKRLARLEIKELDDASDATSK